MNADARINQRAALRSSRIDPRTCRPDAAYPKYGQVVPTVEYVRQFGEALGLKPAPTQFG